jgi:hypothetical protein
MERWRDGVVEWWSGGVRLRPNRDVEWRGRVRLRPNRDVEWWTLR